MNTHSSRRTPRGRARQQLASTVSHPATPTSVTVEGGFPDSALTLDARRHAMIAQAAYFRAERRAFEPGQELEDWCAAEHEIDDSLFRGDVAL